MNPIASWLFSHVSERLFKKFLTGFLANNLSNRLFEVARVWCDQLEPDGCLHVEALFTYFNVDEKSLPPYPRSIFTKLENYECPLRDEWNTALCNQWQWIKEVNPEPQSFFCLPVDIAHKHLDELAKLLELECLKDRERFQVHCHKLLKDIKDSIDSTKEMLVDHDINVRSQFELQSDKHDANTSLLLRILDRLPNNSTKSSFGDEIDSAVIDLKAGKIEIAAYRFSLIREKNWDSLSDRERFRVVANLGYCANAIEDYEKAGKLFIECRQYHDDEKSACLEAAGYAMLGDSITAYSMAQSICHKYPKSDLAWAIWVKNSPLEVTFEKIVQTIPEEVKSLSDTAFALSWRAYQSRNWIEAEYYSRLALSNSPDNDELKERLSIILIEIGRYDALTRNTIDSGQSTRDKATEAKAILNTLLTSSHASPITVRARLHHYMGYACVLLSDDAAEGHFRSAHELQPASAMYARQLALSLAERKKYDTAVSLLLMTLQSDECWNLILLSDYICDNKYDDIDLVETGLKNKIADIGTLNIHDRFPTIWAYTRVLLMRKDIENIANEINSIKDIHIRQDEKHALLSYCHRRKRIYDIAKSHANKAADCIDTETSLFLRRTIAYELCYLGVTDRAFSIWKDIASPTHVNDEIETALKCAYHTGNIQYILDFCSQLRRNKIYDREIIHMEINLLQEYSCYERAVNIMTEYLNAFCECILSREIRARLSHLAINLGKPELICRNPMLLPSVEEVTADFGMIVVQVLAAIPLPLIAVDYAYRLLRQNFNSSDAHKAMVVAVLFNRGLSLNETESETVAPGSAVKYTNNSTQESHWHIIENCDNPDSARNEFAIEQSISQRLLGLVKGSTFYIRNDSYQTITGIVDEVWSKYKYRFNTCMEEWEFKFPEEIFLWRFSTNKSKNPDDPLAEIGRTLDQKKEQINAQEEAYRFNPISVTNFSILTQTTVLQSLIHIANIKDLPIRCCVGNAEEFNNVEECLDSNNPILLDPSALSTLYITDGFKLLSQLGLDLHATEGTLHEFKREYLEKINSLSEGKFLTKIDGQFVFTDSNSPAYADHLKHFKLFLDFLEKVKSIEGISLANFPNKNRLINILGRPSTESIAACYANNMILWTDDSCVAGIAHEHGVKNRIWTDALFRHSRIKNRISLANQIDILNKLLKFGYIYTRLDADSVLQIASQASWSLVDEKLDNCIKWLSNPMTRSIGIYQMASLLMIKARKNLSKPITTSFVASVLSQIAKRRDGQDIIRDLANWIARDNKWDVEGANEIRQNIQLWRKIQ